jgi:hypothetical protein
MADKLTLTLVSTQRPERVAELGRELVADLRKEVALEADHKTRDLSPGERAVDSALVGQVVLTFLSAGAATALLGCLKAYIERDRHLRFRLKKADGVEIELEAQHFSAQTFDELTRKVQEFLRQ